MYQNWSLPTFWLADKLTVTDKLKEYTCSKQANLPRKLFLSHSEIWWFETFISIATLLPCTTDLPIYFTCYYTDLINIIKHFKYDKPLRERKKKWKKRDECGTMTGVLDKNFRCNWIVVLKGTSIQAAVLHDGFYFCTTMWHKILREFIFANWPFFVFCGK